MSPVGSPGSPASVFWSPWRGAASPSAPTSKEQQRAKAVARATEYCKKKGLVMRASNAEAPTRPGQAPSELQFHCVKAQIALGRAEASAAPAEGS